MKTTLDSIKDFQLFQTRNGYRFTIDSVLLANFVKKIKPHTIVDIGAGNGIIGILLAKKYPESEVLLIEIQKDLIGLCKKNITINNLNDRVIPYHCDIREVEKSGRFDQHSVNVIVSNPPFRKTQTGKISPIDEKAIARHEITMNLRDLFRGIDYLLKPKGSLYIIFHPYRIVDLFKHMRDVKIEPKRIRFIHPNAQTESKMVLVEGIKSARAAVKIEKPLFIYNMSGYTEEVRKMIE